MPVFTATFSAVAVSAAQDVFEIVAHASSRVRVRKIFIGQYSDAGDAAAEMPSVQVIRGYTVSGSGGSTVTPANLQPWSRAAVSVVEANNTTVANTGTAEVLISETFNVQAGWLWAPGQMDPRRGASYEDEYIYLEAGSRLVVRITAPADAVTMNGTLVFEEIGKQPTS